MPNDTELRLDNTRPSPIRRPTIGDASPPFRPPITSLPNQRPSQGGWQLGVHADETDTGMLITSVVRGSVADRAGLERGDRILAVGTERVGIVGNRAVSMSKVLRRQADFQGDVLLLIKSRRSRGLINVSIRLGGSGGTQFFNN
jgi:predicted metalloprotease with PDZ domain